MSGSIQSSNQTRAKGWHSGGSGLALETGVSGGNGYVLSYNRTTGSYASTTIESTGVQFVTSSAGKFYFTGGNVGIGTTSPNTKLTVETSNESLYDVLAVHNGITGTSALGKGAAIRIGSGNNGNYSTKIATIYEGNNPSYLQPALAFFTMNNSYLIGSETEKMRITAPGGISFGSTGTAYGTSGQILKSNGNASPTWVAASTVIGGPYLPLTAGSSYPLTDTLYIQPTGSPTNTMLISARADDTYGNIQFTNAAETANWTELRSTSTQFTINNVNVGIGVTGPSEKLSVNGNLRIFGTDTNAIQFENSVAGTRFHYIIPHYNAGLNSLNSLEIQISSATPGNEVSVMTLNGDGNVGIGTASPSKKLHVKESTTATYAAYIENTIAGGDYLAMIGDAGDNVLSLTQEALEEKLF